MALYKPKNLKPSITNGPVNLDITKGGEFSFQVDGNEPIEGYNIKINNINHLVGETTDLTTSLNYIELQVIDHPFLNTYEAPYWDYLRGPTKLGSERYPSLSLGSNLTDSVFFNYFQNGLNILNVDNK